jgi:hypothetical protein
MIGWTAFGTRSIAHHSYVTFDDRSFETLVLLLANEDRQLVSMDIKAGIGDYYVSGKNADRFRRITDSLDGINFGRRSVLLRPLHQLRPLSFRGSFQKKSFAQEGQRPSFSESLLGDGDESAAGAEP